MSMDNEDFIRLYQTDPFVALISRMRAEAWVSGYEAARRDAETAADDGSGLIRPDNQHFEIVAALRRDGGSHLVRRALMDLTNAASRAEANQVLTLAALARVTSHDTSQGHP